MKKIAITIVVIAVTSNVLASTLLWPMDVGQTWHYERSDAVSGPWQVTLEVLSKGTLGSYEYYHVHQSNYDNQGGSEEWDVRSTSDGLYAWNGSADQLAFQTGPIGTVIIDGDTRRELVAIESVTVPYGGPYTAYKFENQDTVEVSPYWYEYIVPGLGIPQQIDYWADTGLGQVAPLEYQLVSIDGFIAGSGTAGDPYLIEDFADFQVFADPCNSATYWASGVNIKLMSDIDLDPALAGRQTYTTAVIAPDTDNTTAEFQGTLFSGMFNGNSKTILNLTIDTGGLDKNFLGLFGMISVGAGVVNLGIEDVNIIGSGNFVYGDFTGAFGALVGDNSGIIQDCWANGSVTGGVSSEDIGGLCGWNQPTGTIAGCYFTGYVGGGANSGGIGGLCGSNDGSITDSWTDSSITGKNSLGGLCGYLDGGSITDCYSGGSVSGNSELGGLCGFGSGSIDNCYATGVVIGGDYSENIGGLCGHNFNGDITNCYTNGSVTGGDSSDYIGGFCGGQSETGSITNCYATGAVTGGNDTWSVGGLCGGGTGTISNCYATGAVAGGNNSERLGGLIGENGDSDLINSDGNVLNCYATGTVTGGTGSSNLGGLCGYQYGSNAEISNSFWDTETSGMAAGYNLDGTYPGTITNVVGKTTVQMRTGSTFTDAGWDFAGETVNGTEDMWMIDEGKDYPRLQLIIMPYSLVGEYWQAWTGVNLTDYSPGSDSGDANITETSISIHFTDHEGYVGDENKVIFSKWFDQQGWLNMHLSDANDSEISQLSVTRNISDYVTRSSDNDDYIGRTLFVKKALGAMDADIVGKYAYFSHWLNVPPPETSANFGSISFYSDYSFSFSADSSDGSSESEAGTWSLDSSNAIVNLSTNGGEQMQVGQDGILMQVDIDPAEYDDLGYSVSVKKGSEKTLQNLAGRYTYQEFTTEPDSNEASTSWGIMEIELDGTLTLIRSYYDGTSATDSGIFTIDSDGTVHVTPDGGGFTFDGVLSENDQTIMLAIMGQSPGGDVGMAIANRSSDCNGNGIADVRDIQGDTNGDGIVNFVDFAKLAEYWLEDNCGMCGCADIVCNGKVDMDDLNTFVENWLADTP